MKGLQEVSLHCEMFHEFLVLYSNCFLHVKMYLSKSNIISVCLLQSFVVMFGEQYRSIHVHL